MNRPTTPTPVSSGGATTQAASGPVNEQLSALVDGELAVGAATALWQQDDAGSGELCATWGRYQLIGDALRGTPSQAADGARVAAIMQRVREERLAASAPAVAPAPVVMPQRIDAANDAVFRWKMLAGFASLAAVVAVAWNMSGAGAPGAAPGPQLAQAPAQVAPTVVANVEPSEPVVVVGQQGPILRDQRLEELMAAHRQVGGMSALQMPAGFLRNAAFDLPEGQR